MKTMLVFFVAAAMSPGAAAAGGLVSSRRGQQIQVADAQHIREEPAGGGFRGDDLGMKGVGFQAGFVGTMPGFGELKFPSPYSIDPMRCPTGMWSVGCVFDTQTQQQFWYKDEVAKEDRVPMTPEMCFQFCKNVSGVQFMGLQNGDECYCTPFFHNTNKGGNGACDMPCTGDASRMCGGQKMAEIYQLHDCSNLPAVPCQTPPRPVPHAKSFESRYYRKNNDLMHTPCKNAVTGPLTSFNQLCSIECDFGYEQFENTLKCEERGNPLSYSWAQIVGAAVCTPVVCGIPLDTLHAKHPYTSYHYPQLAHYTCDIGYTLDADAHGPKSFPVQCHGNASFSEVKQCKPVICGKCGTPEDHEKYGHAGPIETGERHFLQSCNYICEHGYTLDQEAAGRSTFSTSCLATGEFTEPHTCLPVSCGKAPKFAHQPGADPNANVVYPEKIQYKCEDGYTFNQVASGPKQEEVSCQANGVFSSHKECLPVLCGEPPHVEDSTYNPRVLHFLQTVSYRCDYGYSLSGVARTRAQKTIMCGADGQFEQDAPFCHPVVCGQPPEHAHGVLGGISMSAEINFASSQLTYTCDPGYSTAKGDTVWAPYDSNIFSIACQADGTFEYAPPCVNINDCAFVSCGNNGHCEDLPGPLGTHFIDYTCQCNSGYEVTHWPSPLREGELTQKCTNIMDCPRPLDENCGALNAAGNQRGTCADLINDYDCNCENGYEVSHLESHPNNKTCVPKTCGDVPKLPHATTPLDGSSANYDTPTWTYTCDEGYTLNGRAGQPTKFDMRCQAAAVFTTARICLPVTCGTPPLVANSDEDPEVVELFFPHKIVYSCEEGYSTDSKADGVKEFEVECKSNGHATDAKTCEPVECGNVPSHDHAEWDEEKIFVYTESALVKCLAGYSLDRTMAPSSKWYKLPCESDGTYGEPKECKEVKCGGPPHVEHAESNTDDKFYLDEIEYNLDQGYTLDSTPDGTKSFTIKCLDDATFSHTKEPKPVSCGAAPAKEKSTTPAADYTYLQKPVYTCLEGYSTDGVASGPKTFELECQHDGTYDGLPGCMPVECGAVETPPHSEQVNDDSGSQHDSLVYGQHATFRCLPGWSMDGILYSTNLHSTVLCLSNGDLQYPDECVNMDDCASVENTCAENGACEDKAEPTGVHIDDLECKCDSGFAHDVAHEAHFCYNIPDCPDGACEPGSCEDLVNDYKCHCPDGYYEDANPEEDLAHDCLPNLCGHPTVVQHASTEDSDKDIYFDDAPVEYLCDEGYTLDGSAGGEIHFQLACLADQSFQEAPECKPVECGEVPAVQHAKYPSGTKLVYLETVNYECEEGYSTDQTFMSLLQTPHGHSHGHSPHIHAKSRHLAKSKALRLAKAREASFEHALLSSKKANVTHYYSKAENTEFHSECLADGKFTEVKQCLPIKCDAVPTQDHVVVDLAGTGLVYPQELSETCVPGYALTEFEHEDTTYTISCASNGQLEHSYTEVGSEAGCTAINCGDRPKPQKATLEGTTHFGETITVTCDEGHSTSQTCAKADAKYEFTCQTSGEFSKHPDCKRVQCASPIIIEHATFLAGEFYYQDKVMYSANEGYTLNGQHDGMRSFEMECKSDCLYGGKQVFKPVECGAPPDRKKSTHPGIHRVFSKQEPYTCKGGFSVNSKASGPKSFELECQADGEYHGEAGCEPVECGAVEVPENAEHLSQKQDMVFEDVAFFECNPGFSLNGRMDSKFEFQTTCMADGQQSKHAGCKNKDDCEGNKCGNGECKDHDKPTGKHIDDYHCECASGFEEEVQDGYKVCGNVPDCPPGACEPGTCEDLVNDYKCHCPEGYSEGENSAEDMPHDCMPKPCGAPTIVEHATTSEAGTDKFFNSDPVAYECEEGYTLDAAATGERAFEISCRADGTFQQHPTCHPVQCGSAPHVEFSDFDGSKQYVFPEKIEYICETGYTTDGTSAGATTFEGACEAEGDISGVLSCEPVACPEIPEQENAQYSEGSMLVFPEDISVQCHSGFALDEHNHEEVHYTISCTSAGDLHLSNEAGCHAVNCGSLPEVEHAEVEGGSLYGEEATVTCHTGFSTDQTTLEASSHYAISCQANREFTPTQKCEPIRCSVPEDMEHTSNSGDEQVKVFEDEVKYELVAGYTLSGEAGGNKEFTISCHADGTFTALKVPQPVSCGAPPSRTHAEPYGESYVFPESAPYTCATGYSVDGTAGGAKSFMLQCANDGAYEGPQGCEAITCGDVTAPEHSEQRDDQDGKQLTSLVFPEIAKFECLAGYSKDGQLGSDLVGIVVTCQADGTLHFPSECINNDDCLSPENACSPHGQCSDAKLPTGNHEEDFKCDCDDGFEQEVKEDGVRWCKNVPDCPKNACNPGSCHDLVNDYECNCPKGYFEGENAEESLAHDCLAKECGAPPTVKHAEADTGSSVFYDSKPVTYACADGYTVGGLAEDEKSFSLACLDSGFFAEPKECQPVKCGEPPKVLSSLSSTGNPLTFSETVTFTCNEGYSTDSSVDSDKASFTATCEADGAFAGVLECKKILCGAAVPVQDHAVVVEDGEHLLFDEVATVTCIPGYSLSKDDLEKNTYDISCKASGELYVPHPHGCQPIDCTASGHAGSMPEVEHAKVSGSTLFGGDLTAHAIEGYSLDGFATGIKEVPIVCSASGQFEDDLPEFQLVACDLPLFEHVTSMEIVESFLQLPHNSVHFSVPTHSHAGGRDGVAVHHALSQSNRSHSLQKRHRKRNPEPKFGDVVRYECGDGFHAATTITALATEPKGWRVKCAANGDFESVDFPGVTVACVPVACPVHETPGVDFIVHSNKQCTGAEADVLTNFEGSATECMQECRTLSGCSGFVRVHTGEDAGKCFMRGGTLSEAKTHSDDVRDCYERNTEFTYMPQLTIDETFPLTRVYEVAQEYQCIQGFSLDGTPEGETQFEETCLIDGAMSMEHECKDIDYCQGNHCGSDGTCKDDLLGYYCECNDGFLIDWFDQIYETCVQIDECDSLKGNDFCDGGKAMGICVDETLTYKCECTSGYENPEMNEHGVDSCVPITCDHTSHVDHAKPSHIPKLSFEDKLVYTCETGYTLDGTADGAISFTAECNADKSVSGLEECKPIECGSTESVEHATVNTSSLVFGEQAEYSCGEGYTVTGTVSGTNAFVVGCNSEGVISDTLECLPVSCGIPPHIPHAQAPQEKLTLDMEATYQCVEGYTETGQAGAAKEFTAKCLSTGELEGLSKCRAVKCGLPELVSHAELPVLKYEFPEQFEVVCHTGYTVDEDPDGESTFVVKCNAEGEFAGYKECKRVKCGTPQPTQNAESTDTERVFEETASWTCKEGFSIDGTPEGGMTFQKQCQATGSFGTASPSDCMDINFCIGEPCTANGVCSDEGEGTQAPGYSCECFEGFEIAERANGGQKCSEDDCADSPCGLGGTCTDLSQQGAPAGAYKCECDDGYKLVEHEVGHPTCERIECGGLPKVSHVEKKLDQSPLLELKTWLGNDPEIDVLFGTPILMSNDKATYTCAEGYSTDGTTHLESQAFTVYCDTSGLFSPAVSEGASFCVPIKCDNTFIPEVANTEASGALDKYVYGDVLTMKCSEGHTIGGELTGVASFDLTCEANGKFSDDNPTCTPVSCPVHHYDNALASATDEIYFGESITYTCIDGFYLGGAVSEHTKAFGGQCKANGEVDLSDDDPECLPCNCGAPPPVPNSVTLIPGPLFWEFLQVSPGSPAHARHSTKMLAAHKRGGRANGKIKQHRVARRLNKGDEDIYTMLEDGDTLVFEELAIIMCEEGSTIGGVAGGAMYFESECGPFGDFEEGVPAAGPCLPPKYSVNGEIVNAQNGNDKLTDAAINFHTEGGEEVASTTSSSTGRYTVHLPAGTFIVTVTKSGWITREKKIYVKGTIHKGQGADIALSMVLPPGGYRAVVNWAAHSEDLDSWTYFDRNFGKYVFYGKTSIVGAKSGVHVTLDWDDTDGHGPETTTFMNVGSCTHSCLIKFHVDNYSWRDAHLADSDGIVTLYHGDGVYKTFHIPTDIGDERGWTVFTMDASSEPATVLEGDWSYGPFITDASFATKKTSWATSMNSEGWSKVPAGGVLYGMSAYVLDSRLAKMTTAHYYQVQNLKNDGESYQEVDWTGLLAAGKTAACPEGTWITGLYRTGSAVAPPTGAHQITKAVCSSFAGVEKWGKCVEQDIFKSEGKHAASCPMVDGQATAMVALHHVGYPENKNLNGLDKAKCCAFPDELIKNEESQLCVTKQTCAGALGKQ